MIDDVSSSIELRIATDGTNSEMCNKLNCIDRMGEYFYVTYDSNIMILYVLIHTVCALYSGVCARMRTSFFHVVPNLLVPLLFINMLLLDIDHNLL